MGKSKKAKSDVSADESKEETIACVQSVLRKRLSQVALPSQICGCAKERK